MHEVVYIAYIDVNVCGISGRNSFKGEECKTRENSIFLKKMVKR